MVLPAARAPRTDREFYADARYGEMWVGTRDSAEEMAAGFTGLAVAHIDELEQHRRWRPRPTSA